jgi:hypothetical protein
MLKQFQLIYIYIYRLAEIPTLWTIQCRDPLKSCVKGRAVAIGDACHPHLPRKLCGFHHYMDLVDTIFLTDHGQGFGSSIEDAASLAVFISGLYSKSKSTNQSPNKSALPSILQKWQSFRLPRASTVQLMSISFPTPLEVLKPRIRDEIKYGGTLPENMISHEEPVQMWLFQYDIRKEAEEYLAQVIPQQA